MEPNERQQAILAILRAKGRVSVGALARELCYSEMTIRRDLAGLKADGLLQRCHGGAVEPDVNSRSVLTRTLAQDGEKRELARRAAEYLSDGLSVFLDSSSTCLYLVPHLARYKGIRLFTNSVQVLLRAAAYHIPCYLTGGRYMQQDMCLLGPQAERYAEELHVDLAFFSCTGLANDGAITDDTEEHASLRRTVLGRAAQAVMLFDRTKVGRAYPFPVCRREDLTQVITLP